MLRGACPAVICTAGLKLGVCVVQQPRIFRQAGPLPNQSIPRSYTKEGLLLRIGGGCHVQNVRFYTAMLFFWSIVSRVRDEFSSHFRWDRWGEFGKSIPPLCFRGAKDLPNPEDFCFTWDTSASPCRWESRGIHREKSRFLDWILLLMVQKSGKKQLRRIVYPAIYRIFFLHPRWCRISEPLTVWSRF